MSQQPDQHMQPSRNVFVRFQKGFERRFDRFREGFLFYYFGNELHGVRSGKWKLRTKNLLKNENIYDKNWRDTAAGDIAVPAALYNLAQDPGEQRSVLRDHPKVVEQLRGYLDEARADLGDSLVGKPPTNDRPIGRVD